MCFLIYTQLDLSSIPPSATWRGQRSPSWATLSLSMGSVQILIFKIYLRHPCPLPYQATLELPWIGQLLSAVCKKFLFHCFPLACPYSQGWHVVVDPWVCGCLSSPDIIATPRPRWWLQHPLQGCTRPVVTTEVHTAKGSQLPKGVITPQCPSPGKTMTLPLQDHRYPCASCRGTTPLPSWTPFRTLEYIAVYWTKLEYLICLGTGAKCLNV